MAKYIILLATTGLLVSAAPTAPAPAPAAQSPLVLADFRKGVVTRKINSVASWTASVTNPSFPKSLQPATDELTTGSCTSTSGYGCPASPDNTTGGIWTGNIPATVYQDPRVARLDAALVSGQNVNGYEGIEVRFSYQYRGYSGNFDITKIRAVIGGGFVTGRWEYTAAIGDFTPWGKGGVGTTALCAENTYNTVPQNCLYSAFIPFKNFRAADGSKPNGLQLIRVGSVGLQATDAVTTTAKGEPYNPTGKWNIYVHSINAVSGSAMPPPAPDAPGHLWFRFVNKFSGSSGNCENGLCRCGEVDAGAVNPFDGGPTASRVPAALFKPINKKYLKAYADFTIGMYKFPLGPGFDGFGKKENTTLELGRCADIGFTSPGGKMSAAWAVRTGGYTPAAGMGGLCEAACGCSFQQSCPDVVDTPFSGKWCSLCGPKYNAPFYVDLYNKFTATTEV